jgi:hypothetical protein
MVRAFQKRDGKRPASKLESTTLRGFGGGWNAIDEDLSMPPKYQVSLVNFHRTSSGSQAVRFGQMFNTDIKSVNNSPILDGYYFNGRNLVVCANGWIVTIDETGVTKTVIWSPAIAAALPGAPGGWSTGLTHITFVPFKDTLVIHNGVDKPLSIKSSFVVQYLQDLGTGSNVNVPIGRYGCVAANYHCVSGIPANPTEIVISSKGTSGVFIGDPAPNDSISIDVGAYAPEGAASIRGIAGFRTYLLVFLQNITLQIKLGEYDDNGIHIPKFPDTLPQFGLLGNRCIVTVENDLMFCGLSGLASAKRNLYSPDTVMSDYLSSVVSPAYRRAVGGLTDSQQLNITFALYDRLNNDFLLFLLSGNVLVYTFNTRLKMHAWSEYEGMDWASGWTSILGRLFLAKGTRVFLAGNSTFQGETYYADRLLDRDYAYAATGAAFAANDLVFDSTTGEVWKCLTTHNRGGFATFELERDVNPTMWSLYEGNPIAVEMELPWIDGKDPTKLKQLRYISVATKGDAEFSFDAYADNLYKDVDGNVVHNAAVSMVLIGNDAYGYGFDDGGYGMGRRSRDPRLYGFPLKFKNVKFRIWGNINKKLELVNLSFLYARGKYAR